MASSIQIVWAAEAGGVAAFSSGPINLVAPHRQADVSDCCIIVLIQGIAPADFDLVGATCELCPFGTSSSAHYRIFLEGSQSAMPRALSFVWAWSTPSLMARRPMPLAAILAAMIDDI
jgi:hypothetical protein